MQLRTYLLSIIRIFGLYHIPLISAILIIYMGFGSGYTWNYDPVPFEKSNYFDFLAEAFLKGNLDINVPKATLDMSPYKGHIYLYWGPLNALPQMFIRLFIPYKVSMCLLTVIYCFIGIIFFACILRYLNNLFFTGERKWIESYFICTIACGSPLFFIATRSSSFHHQNIGLSFLAQMLTILTFLWVAKSGSRKAIIVFSLGIVLALGVRLTNLFLLPGILIGAYILSSKPRLRNFITRYWLPMILITFTIGGLLLYNKARFENPFETGMRYQTGNIEQRKLLYEHSAMISLRWLPTNFKLYFLLLPRFNDGFPKFEQLKYVPIPDSLKELYPPEKPFVTDLSSVIFMTPLISLFLLLIIVRPEPMQIKLCYSFGLSVLGIISFLLCFAGASLRYSVDFIPLMLLLSFIATQHYLKNNPKYERLFRSLFMFLLLWSTIIFWQFAKHGARKVLSILILVKDMPLTNPAWAYILGLILTIALFFELYILELRLYKSVNKF